MVQPYAGKEYRGADLVKRKVRGTEVGALRTIAARFPVSDFIELVAIAERNNRTLSQQIRHYVAMGIQSEKEKSNAGD